MEALQSWIDRQYRASRQGLLGSLSRTDLVKRRPGFGQTVRPAKGSIVASPVLAAYDPDPDYCFHWYRDAAVVVDALRLLYEDGSLGEEALRHLADYVAFNRHLASLDGRDLVADAAWRAHVAEDFRRFVRDEADLAAVHGDAVAADTRVNPDGTLDISKWARPQHDGPPLRALSLLRWRAHLSGLPSLLAEVDALIRDDIAFVERHWGQPCYDIWEEEPALHFYTLCACARALEEGAVLCSGQGAQHDDAVREIRGRLGEFWCEERGHYRSRLYADGRRSAKQLDIAVILAAIHAGGDEAFGPLDARMQATLDRLEALFDRLYAINHARDPRRRAAMGRYEGDVYYSGGAYYFSTLGAAEFCYRAAQSGREVERWCERGDGFLETVRAYTPDSGELSEQFDQTDGRQTCARQLAWSHAAFISCVTARRAARREKTSGQGRRAVA